MFSIIKKCRICNSEQLTKYMSFGAMPLANALVDLKKQETDLFFPLEVMFCENCKLSQLNIVVNPEILFSSYAYMSSISKALQQNFAEMSEQVKEFFPETEKCLVLDIASNDGCELEQFKKRNFKVVGVDPAKNLAKIAEQKGIPTIVAFWDEKTAEKIVKEYGKPQVVTAANVFAHVHDVHGFIENVKKVLSLEGIFILEFPHALNLIEKNEFDTIYHEHLSYFLVKPLLTLFEMHRMVIFDIQEISTHGGSIRVFVKHPKNDKIKVNEENIQKLIEEEKKKGLYEIEKYFEFAHRAMDVKIAFLQLLSKLKKEGKKIAGYGAAAKASTLLNYCGIGTDYVKFIVDDAPEKQNKAFSGNRVPIVPNAVLEKEKPDYLVIFAWNIAHEIIKKTKDFQKRNGKYIIPMPFPKIVTNEAEL